MIMLLLSDVVVILSNAFWTVIRNRSISKSHDKSMRRQILRRSTYSLIYLVITLIIQCSSMKISRNLLLLSSHSRGRRRMTSIFLFNKMSSASPELGQNAKFFEERSRCEKLFSESDQESVDVTLISKSIFKEWRSSVRNDTLDYLEAINHSLKSFPSNKIVALPGSVGTPIKPFLLAFYNDEISGNKLGYKRFDSFWSALRPGKNYRFINQLGSEIIDCALANDLAKSWALYSYQFQSFKSKPTIASNPTVVWPPICDRGDVLSLVKSYYLMKDLVETPALSLGPAELHRAAVDAGNALRASSIQTSVGVAQLLENNFPQVAAVGMASSAGREPRIVDISWDPPSDGAHVDATTVDQAVSASRPPLDVVIVGKGVTFDTGGLNIKGAGGMRNMKKDMAGAAQALALASLIVETKLPVRLRLLLPIVENSISGEALRPGDVIRARNGKTTEITNTDAEGRLILADALAAAVEAPHRPDVVIDFATLTGAARVALGSDLPAVFSNNLTALERLWRLSSEINDPVWMMPLHEPMRANLKSSIADLVNAAEGAGGAITAALYLSEFIKPVKSVGSDSPSADSSATQSDKESEIAAGTAKNSAKTTDERNHETIWFHFDFMGTKGGVAEPQGMRTAYEYIKSAAFAPIER